MNDKKLSPIIFKRLLCYLVHNVRVGNYYITHVDECNYIVKTKKFIFQISYYSCVKSVEVKIFSIKGSLTFNEKNIINIDSAHSCIPLNYEFVMGCRLVSKKQYLR